jgi:hypothetical protein
VYQSELKRRVARFCTQACYHATVRALLKRYASGDDNQLSEAA